MSFAPAKLAVLAYANGFTLWYYDTADDAQQLVAPGYFNIAAGILRRGDLIFSSSLILGTRKTGLSLVTAVSDEHITVESLQSGTAEGLSDLHDVTIESAKTKQVLTFESGVWVNQDNPGIAGDAHACETGNPHRTTAADIGAIALGEKGQPYGLATLGADGMLSAAQVRSPALSDLRDIAVTNPAAGQILKHDGSAWVSAAEAGVIGDAFAASHAAAGPQAHAVASDTDAGFLSAADKQKLDGIADGASANPLPATPQDIAAGTETEPRLFSPAQIKTAVLTHVPAPATDSIDNVALANMAASRIKGRAVGTGLGDPQDLSATQVRTILNVQDGATAAGAAGDAHAAIGGNPHQTTAAHVGAIPSAEKGATNGVAMLDATGKVPAAQLPISGGGAVASVFGRTGAVTAAAGDYSAAQVGAPPLARQITTGGSLTGGGDLSADRTVLLVGDATNPGNSKYYGTNASGAKGFHDFAAASVSSVFGRTGPIAAQTGDYTAAQVGAVPTTEKGAANGIATLDGSRKLTASQIPTHTHAVADVTGLQTALDARASVREAKVAAYTVATTGVGLNESVVIGKATSAITLTLTTNTDTAEKLSVTNRGTAPLTIAAGSGQTIKGGSIVLQPATGALNPSSVCLVRDPSDNTWLVI